jgi:hypothetical protein
MASEFITIWPGYKIYAVIGNVPPDDTELVARRNAAIEDLEAIGGKFKGTKTDGGIVYDFVAAANGRLERELFDWAPVLTFKVDTGTSDAVKWLAIVAAVGVGVYVFGKTRK